MHQRSHFVVVIALLLLGGCRTGRDYPVVGGPRYAGAPSVASPPDTARPVTLRIASFNIAFAEHIDGALTLIRSDSVLRRADVLLLQEMDSAGAQRIAGALGMWYVYYPAIFHFRSSKDFGNAVLSRWPIVEDAKLVLPHASRFARTHRTATVATLRVGASHVRVYSTHLGTVADIRASRRRDQLRAILADAAKHSLVIIGGDLNDADVGRVAADAGYAWPTRDGPRTTRFGRWDHVFLKGIAIAQGSSSGTVDASGVSDHHAIWTIGILR